MTPVKIKCESCKYEEERYRDAGEDYADTTCPNCDGKMSEYDPLELAVVSFSLNKSTAVLRCKSTGEGNSRVFTFEVTSDGGQFPDATVEKTKTGFKLSIVGEWETEEFTSALNKYIRLMRI